MLFYKPARDGKWIDNAISGWTRIWNLGIPKELVCSHQEIWTPDTNNLGHWMDGWCWTSTMGQVRNKGTKYNGVCCRPASEILKHPERWYYAEFDVCDEAYKKMVEFMQDEVKNNKGYDVSMILNFFIPIGIGRKDKWICSEFSNAAAKIGLGCQCTDYKDIADALSDKFSPMRTASTLYKLGVKFYNLDGTELLPKGEK